MKLIHAQIIEFGCFRDRSFDFGEGMNIIEGHNESGKSTLLGFIRFMLYGMQSRAALGEVGDRDRNLSWTGRRAAGSLTLSADGKMWRIERDGSMVTTARGDSYSEKPVVIIDVETGAVAHKGKCPGELFLGMNAAVFNSTCAVSQLSAQNINSSELGNCIENILQAADESINLTKVCRRLDDARKELIHKNGRGGRIYDLKCEAERLTDKMHRAEQNAHSIIELEARAAVCRAETSAAMEKQNKLSELWERSEAWLILGRFEQAQSDAEALSMLEQRLTRLRQDSFPGGFTPDEEYAAELKELSARLDRAITDHSDAELRSRSHDAVPTYDTQKADIAEHFTEAGYTKQSFLEKYTKLRRAASGAKTLGIMALLCGLIALGGGALSALVLRLEAFGIGLAALGAVGVVSGIVLLISAPKKRRATLELISNALRSDTDNGAAELERYVELCLEAARVKQQHKLTSEALANNATEQKAALMRIASSVSALLARSGVRTAASPDAMRTSLSDTASRVREFILTERSLLADIERSGEALERLRGSLETYDEGFIRSKASKLDRNDAISAAEHTRLREQYAAEIREAYDRQTAVERQIAYCEGQESSPARISTQLEQCNGEIERLSLHADAFILAREAIELASGKLRRGFTPGLRSHAEKLLSPLTGDRYVELGISDDFALSLVADGSTHSVTQLSGGTRDAAYLSLRLSLTALLCQKEKPPVLLDEALSQLDDRRASAMLAILDRWCEDGNQCLLFTCHTREAGLARDFTHIHL